MKAINIEWDVDFEEDRELLPTEIEIPKGMEDDDEVSDYLSDVTGYCHKGFELMKIRYYVCGLGYDKDGDVNDYETDFGDFDTLEEAYGMFMKLQDRNEESFFEDAPEVYELLIQLEECEETDEEITCIDVKDEFGVTNPNFKEEV